MEMGRAIAVAGGLAVAGAACAGAAPPAGPLPSGEPVAIAYANVTAHAPTGAAASLSGERLRETNARTVEDLLTQRFPGVNVTRLSDGRVAVRIRGPNTLIGGTEPLLVIDGVPVQYDAGGVLRGLRASDIVSIQVLKNASDTAIFGSRGGNGVIMISTRRAR